MSSREAVSNKIVGEETGFDHGINTDSGHKNKRDNKVTVPVLKPKRNALKLLDHLIPLLKNPGRLDKSPSEETSNNTGSTSALSSLSIMKRAR